MKKWKKPPKIFYYFLSTILFPYFKIKNHVRYDRKEIKGIKGPVVVLCNHPSRPDFVYCASTLLPNRLNIVMARYYMYYPKIKPLLTRIKVIPKDLFRPDNSTIKGIISVIKQKGNVLIMPEGRLSSDGTNNLMPEGTEKLIKKLGVPVINIHVNGGYLTGAKWITKRRRGLVEVKASLLFSKEDLERLSIDEIKEKIESAISYNDFEWIKTKPDLEYKGKNLCSGLESILYRCPHCHQEFTFSSKHHHFICGNCDYDVFLTPRYKFESHDYPVYFENIHEWFSYQRECAKKDWEDPNFSLTTKVTLKIPVTRGSKTKLEVVGEGECKLDRNGLSYHGTELGEEVNYFFPLSAIPTLLFGCKEDFEIYYDNRFFYFVPLSQIEQVAKWSVYAEAAFECFCKNQ